MTDEPDIQSVARAAEAIASADGLLVGAGAGMGVDSGLPDFRGEEGFWRHYPPFEERNLDFYDLARPDWFERDPQLAWGFYGHRLHLYRETEPHRGFDLLRRWGDGLDAPTFVFTSNVDGQFQRAGFAEDRIVECHGSIHHLQCQQPCRETIWSADELDVEIDEETFRAEGELPTCPECERIARPNVLMFGDLRWVGARTSVQQERYRTWLERHADGSLAVVECGAGRAVPTVRRECEKVARRSSENRLIRINPGEPQAPSGAVSIAVGALAALSAIDEDLDSIT
ncbi:MAG: NAD-dependent deacetylase [Bradymonadaceae bacterium]